MCGITGIVSRRSDEPVSRELHHKMTASIAHRGPDDSGTFTSGRIGLGHRRLSIIDLVGGHQPMVDYNSGRVLVYNGEIYNFSELRARLKREGVRFETNSDTEVLLKVADFDRFDWLEDLNGMFAFALWDPKGQRLLLARDRLGIKPLYWADCGQQLVFGSEIKALLLHPQLARSARKEKIMEYLAFRHVAGEETLFGGIQQIPPGHIALLAPPDYQLKFVRYWNEGAQRDVSLYADPTKPHTEQFSEIFCRAVSDRLVSDVPLGTFNSGGVDSSLVSSIARRSLSGDLHTFSTGFLERSHDESPYAQRVAQFLGTDHHTLVMGEVEYAEAIPATLWHLEEPINHAHTVQLLHLSKLAKQFVTVVLTGEGADELFAGYPRHKIPVFLDRMRFLPIERLRLLLLPLFEELGLRRLIKAAEIKANDGEALAIENTRYVPLEQLSRVANERPDLAVRRQIYNQRQTAHSPLGRLLYLDQRTYLPSLLTRLDKTSMAAGLEARVPFLDYRLVEWSYKMPDRVKLRRLTNKWVVKAIAGRWLPKDIVERKKVGFGVPVAKWLRNRKGLGRYLELLTDRSASERGIFDTNVISGLVKEHLSERYDHSEVLWSLLNLELWYRVWIDQESIS